MKSVFTRLIAGVAIGAAASLTMVAVPAQAAVPQLSSVIKNCSQFPHNGFGGQLYYSDRASKCAQVYTWTNVNKRSGPGTGYAYTGTLSAGGVYEFDCWTTGSYVDGDNIWLRVYAAGTMSYVSDRYIYTGPNVTTILGHC